MYDGISLVANVLGIGMDAANAAGPPFFPIIVKVDALRMDPANVTGPICPLQLVTNVDAAFPVKKKQPMNVWRDERARDIFVGGTTPMEWSTMPLEPVQSALQSIIRDQFLFMRP